MAAAADAAIAPVLGGGIHEYVGWVDQQGSRVIVRAETIVCLVRRPDDTFFVNSSGNKDDKIKDLNVFKSLEEAYVWLTLPVLPGA